MVVIFGKARGNQSFICWLLFQVGQILITPPAVTSITPHQDVLLNGPVRFLLRYATPIVAKTQLVSSQRERNGLERERSDN